MENPRGVLVDRDELTGWVRSMDQYRSGKGAYRQFWLSAWSGGPVRVHRKNQDAGPVRVVHPYVSVVGGLPPDLLTTMRDERAGSDGFRDRTLFAYPKEFPAAGETWTCIPEDCEQRWGDSLARLRALETEDDHQQGPRPRFVRLTACGRTAWKRFTDALAAERNDESRPDCLKSASGKPNRCGARLAPIVLCLRLATGEAVGEDVDGESMDRAAQLVSYYQGHARRVYSTTDVDPRSCRRRKRSTRRGSWPPLSALCRIVSHRSSSTGGWPPRATARPAATSARRPLLLRTAGAVHRPSTVNHYVRAVKGFSHWLVSDRRTGSDPLAGLSGVSTSEDVRRGRRACRRRSWAHPRRRPGQRPRVSRGGRPRASPPVLDCLRRRLPHPRAGQPYPEFLQPRRRHADSDRPIRLHQERQDRRAAHPRRRGRRSADLPPYSACERPGPMTPLIKLCRSVAPQLHKRLIREEIP